MIIRALNNLTEKAPKTYLSNTEVVGTTVFRLKNSNGFGSQWAFQVGETGDAQSEILILSGTPSGTVGTSTAASRFEHSADSPVYAIKWNQIVFEVSTAGTAGTAVPLTNGTVTITPNNFDQNKQQSYTIFDDPTGTPAYAYKTYFRNSALPLTSIESDWITSAGFSFYSLATLRQRVKAKLWNSQFVTDDVIDDWINEWKDEMSNAVISVNEDYALGTVNVTFGTSGLGTITTADFKQPRKVEITYGSGYVVSTKQSVIEFDPNQVFDSSRPFHDWEGDNIIHVKPAQNGGTAKITFYRFGTTMVNDTDELPVPMRSYTKSFVDYGLAQALTKDNKAADANTQEDKANLAKQIFVSQIVPRDESSTTMVQFTDPISAEDDVIQ